MMYKPCDIKQHSKGIQGIMLTCYSSSFINLFNHSIPIFYFGSVVCLTTYFGKSLKKHCLDGQYAQHSFKYFLIHTLVFEKT
jgi:hypothetical protein